MLGADLPFLVSGCSEYEMGQIAEILPEQMRVFARRCDEKDTQIDFSPEKHAGLIILGDIKDWATSGLYQRERAWLATALDYSTPVLGICYGAQLLAAHLERQSDGKPLSKVLSKLRTKDHPKDHWGVLTPVAVEGEGKTDPVVGHLAEGASVTQYHWDFFEKEPSGATALVWSKEHKHRHCEAFRVGCPEAAVYGVQFHPEPTLQMLQAKRKGERWFKTIPPREMLERAVKAGEKALRAWVALATAHRVKMRRESN
jgi:GMP synthase-like glutamine amidotransferase